MLPFGKETKQMGMFDTYIPDPAIACPVCGAVLENWQGKDAQCMLLTWKQNEKHPIAHAWPEESVPVDQEFLDQFTLPAQFTIYTNGCNCDRMIYANGTCLDGIWISTELVTPENYRTLPTDSTKDVSRKKEDLRKWLQQG